MRNFINCTVPNTDRVIKSKRTKCMHGRYEKYIQNFGRKKLEGRYHLLDLDVDGRTVLE